MDFLNLSAIEKGSLIVKSGKLQTIIYNLKEWFDRFQLFSIPSDY
jgi:hypothetical protein